MVAVNQASPELLADMHRVPARLRAERMRMLASLGLAATGSVHVTTSQACGPYDLAEKRTANKDRLAVDFAKALDTDV